MATPSWGGLGTTSSHRPAIQTAPPTCQRDLPNPHNGAPGQRRVDDAGGDLGIVRESHVLQVLRNTRHLAGVGHGEDGAGRAHHRRRVAAGADAVSCAQDARAVAEGGAGGARRRVAARPVGVGDHASGAGRAHGSAVVAAGAGGVGGAEHARAAAVQRRASCTEGCDSGWRGREAATALATLLGVH